MWRNNMNHNLETPDTPEYLRIVLSGVVDELYAGQLLEDFVAALTEGKHHRVLVDRRPTE
jgi:hypothetical protein